MLNKKLHLSEKIFKKDIEKKSTREGFGEGLVLAGEQGEKIVVLTTDLKDSTKTNLFADKFPERFFDVGVAEQALVTIASGMANAGKIPFVSSYAVFSPGRNWEQIRTTIAINNMPVKIIGSHAGISVGEDGATHQALEDIALMRVLPNMVVVVPADSEQAKLATMAIAQNGKPSYLRLTRSETPVFTTSQTPFEIGRAQVLWEAKSPSVGIIGCGPLVYEALIAAKELEKNGIDVTVVNCHTIKPLDEGEIIKLAKLTGAIVTVEEHQIAGGLGSAVAEVLAKNFPVPMEFIGMNDSFGESGKPEELLLKYHMTKEDIVEAVKKVLQKKNS